MQDLSFHNSFESYDGTLTLEISTYIKYREGHSLKSLRNKGSE